MEVGQFFDAVCIVLYDDAAVQQSAIRPALFNSRVLNAREARFAVRSSLRKILVARSCVLLKSFKLPRARKAAQPLAVEADDHCPRLPLAVDMAPETMTAFNVFTLDRRQKPHLFVYYIQHLCFHVFTPYIFLYTMYSDIGAA